MTQPTDAEKAQNVTLSVRWITTNEECEELTNAITQALAEAREPLQAQLHTMGRISAEKITELSTSLSTAVELLREARDMPDQPCPRWQAKIDAFLAQQAPEGEENA